MPFRTGLKRAGRRQSAAAYQFERDFIRPGAVRLDGVVGQGGPGAPLVGVQHAHVGIESAFEQRQVHGGVAHAVQIVEQSVERLVRRVLLATAKGPAVSGEVLTQLLKIQPRSRAFLTAEALGTALHRRLIPGLGRGRPLGEFAFQAGQYPSGQARIGGESRRRSGLFGQAQQQGSLPPDLGGDAARHPGVARRSARESGLLPPDGGNAARPGRC